MSYEEGGEDDSGGPSHNEEDTTHLADEIRELANLLASHDHQHGLQPKSRRKINWEWIRVRASTKLLELMKKKSHLACYQQNPIIAMVPSLKYKAFRECRDKVFAQMHTKHGLSKEQEELARLLEEIRLGASSRNANRVFDWVYIHRNATPNLMAFINEKRKNVTFDRDAMRHLVGDSRRKDFEALRLEIRKTLTSPHQESGAASQSRPTFPPAASYPSAAFVTNEPLDGSYENNTKKNDTAQPNKPSSPPPLRHMLLDYGQPAPPPASGKKTNDGDHGTQEITRKSTGMLKSHKNDNIATVRPKHHSIGGGRSRTTSTFSQSQSGDSIFGLSDEHMELAELMEDVREAQEGHSNKVFDWDYINSKASPKLLSLVEEKRSLSTFQRNTLRCLVPTNKLEAFAAYRRAIQRPTRKAAKASKKQTSNEKKRKGVASITASSVPSSSAPMQPYKRRRKEGTTAASFLLSSSSEEEEVSSSEEESDDSSVHEEYHHDDDAFQQPDRTPRRDAATWSWADITEEGNEETKEGIKRSSRKKVPLSLSGDLKELAVLWELSVFANKQSRPSQQPDNGPYHTTAGKRRSANYPDWDEIVKVCSRRVAAMIEGKRETNPTEFEIGGNPEALLVPSGARADFSILRSQVRLNPERYQMEYSFFGQLHTATTTNSGQSSTENPSSVGSARRSSDDESILARHQYFGLSQLSSEQKELARLFVVARETRKSWEYIESKASPALRARIFRTSSQNPEYLEAPLRYLVPRQCTISFHAYCADLVMSGKLLLGERSASDNWNAETRKAEIGNETKTPNEEHKEGNAQQYAKLPAPSSPPSSSTNQQQVNDGVGTSNAPAGSSLSPTVGQNTAHTARDTHQAADRVRRAKEFAEKIRRELLDFEKELDTWER